MPEFFLTIPCSPGKFNPDEVQPILACTGRDSTGADECMYICPFCLDTFTNGRTARRHIGIGVMFNDVKKVACTVLRELSSERELFVRANFARIRREIERKYEKKRGKG